MGYRIDYEKGAERSYIPKEKPSNRNFVGWTVGIMIAIILFACIGKERLTGWLIPGQDEITKQAYQSFAQDLQGGASFGAAFETFCREIIENA